MNREELRRAASEFRETWKKVDGLVVIFDGKVSGWISGMHSASDWRPGAVAVGPLGMLYEATGGSDEEGAHNWELIRD